MAFECGGNFGQNEDYLLQQAPLLVSQTDVYDAGAIRIRDSYRAGYSLPRLAGLCRRHKWIITLVGLPIMCAASIFLWRSPPQYEAELKLLVKRERLDSLITTQDQIASTPAWGNITEAEIRTEIELLRSRDLLRTIVEQYGAPSRQPVPEMEADATAWGVRDLEKHLRVDLIAKTNVISAKYVAGDPKGAANVLDALARLYLNKHVAVHRNADTGAFFGEQVNRLQAEDSAAREDLARFQQAHDASLLEERKQSTLKRAGELEATLQDVKSQIREAEQRVRLLDRQRDSLSSTIQSQSKIARNEALIERLKSQLLDLENKRTSLLTKYEPGYRLVQEADKQIADTRAALEREQTATVVDRTEAVNPLRQSIESDLLRAETTLAGLRARQASLASDLETYHSRQQALDSATAKNEDLQRRVKIVEENYLADVRKLEESRVADALDKQKILNVSIIEPPLPPELPMDQHRALKLLLAMTVAIFAALGSAWVAELVEPSVLNETHLSAITGLPVLTAISEEGGLPCSYAISD